MQSQRERGRDGLKLSVETMPELFVLFLQFACSLTLSQDKVLGSQGNKKAGKYGGGLLHHHCL